MRFLLPFLLLFLLGCEQPDTTPIAFADVRIVNGQVIDGTGAPGFVGEVAITGDTISYVGPTREDDQVASGRVIDAKGRVISPGFIDPHSHGDPFKTPEFENFLAMGVTTITLGQDGSSPPVPDLSVWQNEIAEAGIAPNLAMFVGHGTLRELAGIGRDPVPTDEALARMLELLRTNLSFAFGLSTGLEYNPGLNAGDDEMLSLATVVGEKNRVIMSHVRNEDDPVLAESLAELIRQGSKARVHVSHLKSVYGKEADRAEEILQILEEARAAGVKITADVYPYTASYTGLSLLFPVWAKTMDQFEVARRERREELATYLRNRVNGRNGPGATLLGTPPHAGKTLADLATEMEKPFEDVLIDDLGPDGGSAAYFIMDEALQTRLIQDSQVSICSDGSPTGFHPRGHGTFARIIETYVQDQQALTLEEAVRKMTSLPAGIIGLDNRGVLAVGKAADVIVFDPGSVRENATYSNPLVLSEGFDLVMINGHVARELGLIASPLNGRILRP